MFFLADGGGSRDPLLGNMNEHDNHKGVYAFIHLLRPSSLTNSRNHSSPSRIGSQKRWKDFFEGFM